MLERRKHSHISWKLGMVILISVLITGCSTGFVSEGKGGTPVAPAPVPLASSPTNGLVQSSNEGNVTIEVKWLGRDGSRLVFEVTMDTHSVDLDRYDLGKLAVLRDDGGNEYRPAAWDSAPGGHHRQGTLTFSLPDSLSQGRAGYVMLIIQDVAGVKERVFQWEL